MLSSTQQKSENTGNSLSYTTINTVAGAVSAGLHLFVFHPFDTMIKRLQNGQSLQSDRSLYQGLGMAGVLKVTHRMIKYGGESAMRETLCKKFSDKDPVKLRLLSGGIVGAMEALMTTPLDTLKAQKQSGTTKNYLKLWMAEKSRHFKPTPITLLRNSLGTAAFFGADSALRHYVYKVNDTDILTNSQKILSSASCPTIGTIACYPADLIKTRLQINSELPNARAICKNVIKEQGLQGLYKGVTVKILTTFPSAVTGYFLFQVIRDGLENKYATDVVEPKHIERNSLIKTPANICNK